MSRVRTESMIQRLAKKPLSEGFELWDKDYVLGALRLFQCKLESSPPFEVAPCLEAIATLLASIEEYEDAVEHFMLAADKYDLIQKTILAALMKARATELRVGDEQVRLEAALKEVTEIVDSAKPDPPPKDAMQLARVLTYRADLYGKSSDFAAGIADCKRALELKPGRMEPGDVAYLTHYQLGLLYQADGDIDAAEAAFTAALDARPHSASAEALIPIKRAAGKLDAALETIEKAYSLHPKAALLREKAFLLSELGRDEEGLAVVEEGIANPPHEETEALVRNTASVATLHKAKAAILADAGRLEEARAALKRALELDPQDAEAVRMSADVSTSLARDYLAQNNIPQFLDALVKLTLKEKPADPCAFMVDAIERNEVPLP